MDSFLLEMFQRQVNLQCQFLLLAGRDLDRGLVEGDPLLVFYSIQNLLTAAANISKALWGTQPNKAAAKRRMREREPLRASLDVTDTSPLRRVQMALPPPSIPAIG